MLATHPIRETKTRFMFAKPEMARYGINEVYDVAGSLGGTNSPFGAGKVAAEKYTREYGKHFGIPTIINRMSCIYGVYQKGAEEQGWVDWFLRAKKYGRPITIFGNGKQVRDVLFGRDLASLYVYQIEHISNLSGKTFNVGGGTSPGFHTSLLELVAMIDEHFPGKKLAVRFAPARPNDQRVYVSDIRMLRRVTGWHPTTPLLTGLRKMWKAYDSNYQ